MMMAATANPATTTASLFFSYNYQRRPLPVVGLCRNSITTSIRRRRISFIPKSSSSSSSSSSSCCTKIPQLAFFSPWTGLKPLLAFSRRNICIHKENKGRRHRGKVVYASLFGVGAPEALVIGVVALLVFGPKGLAEVARNLGKTLRAFQPTIRELQEVSRDFKSTLEREIGLDEVAPSTDYTYKPTSSANEGQETVVDPRHNQWQTSTDKGSYEFADGMPKTGAYTSEDLLKITQEQLTASAVGPQTQTANPKEQPQGSMANTPSELQPSTTQEATAEVTSSEKTDKER